MGPAYTNISGSTRGSGNLLLIRILASDQCGLSRILYVFEELKLKKTQEKKFGVQMG